MQTELKGVLHAFEEKLAEKRNKVPNSGPPFFFDGFSPLVFSYKLLSFLSLFLSLKFLGFPKISTTYFRLYLVNTLENVPLGHFKACFWMKKGWNLVDLIHLDEGGWKSCGFGLVKWLWVSIFALNERWGALQMPLHNLPLALDWLHRYINWSTLFATTNSLLHFKISISVIMGEACKQGNKSHWMCEKYFWRPKYQVCVKLL